MQDLDVGLLGTLPLAPAAPPAGSRRPLPPPRPEQALPEVVETGHSEAMAMRGNSNRWNSPPPKSGHS